MEVNEGEVRQLQSGSHKSSFALSESPESSESIGLERASTHASAKLSAGKLQRLIDIHFSLECMT